MRTQGGDVVTPKGGPLKATLPIASVLRGPIVIHTSGPFGALSPPPLMRHISPPEYSACGQRSPGALHFTGEAFIQNLLDLLYIEISPLQRTFLQSDLCVLLSVADVCNATQVYIAVMHFLQQYLSFLGV